MIASLNTIARLWWEWSAAMFWQVGLLIVLVACIDRLIRRRAWPQLRYALWSLILVKLVLPPTLSLPSGVVPELRPVVGQAVRWMDSEAPVADESSVLKSLYEHSAAAKAVRSAPEIPVAFAAIKSYEPVEDSDSAGGASTFRGRHPQPIRQAQGSASLEAATLAQENPDSASMPILGVDTRLNSQLSWQFYASHTTIA